MPHVAMVPLTGFRIAHPELLALGLRLPGLKRRGRAIAQLPSLGLLTLAGMTHPSFSISYHEAGDESDEAVVQAVIESKPDLVAFSVLTASAPRAYRLSAAMRRAGLKTVLGGLHATACSQEALQYFDAVVVGDGEIAWPQLLKDVSRGCLERTYQPSPVFDLSQSVAPRWDLLPHHKHSRWTLQTQRGCPLACEFCAASRLLGRFREKPLENIRGELEAIRNLDATPLLELADDNTFAGSRDPHALFEVLAESRVSYFTESDWRIGLRRDLLEGLAASGCVQVLVGIESLVHDYNGMGAKRREVGRVMEALAAVQESGVAVIGCFIVGVEGETRRSVEALGEFLDECELADVQVTLQTPFPGTPLYTRMRQQGRILAGRGWDHYTLFDVTYQPDAMSVAELETAFKELLAWTYRPQATQRRQAIRRRIWRRHPRFNPSARWTWRDT